MAKPKKAAALKAPPPRCTRASLRYWLKQLEGGSVQTAIWRHPARAQRFFGAVPVLRGDMELLRRIADAHRTLWSSDYELLEPVRRFRRLVREEAKSAGEARVTRLKPGKAFGTNMDESEVPQRLRQMALRTLEEALG